MAGRKVSREIPKNAGRRRRTSRPRRAGHGRGQRLRLRRNPRASTRGDRRAQGGLGNLNTEAVMSSALDGTVVLESGDERGEFAGLLLASLGAGVIKLEGR